MEGERLIWRGGVLIKLAQQYDKIERKDNAPTGTL